MAIPNVTKATIELVFQRLYDIRLQEHPKLINWRVSRCFNFRLRIANNNVEPSSCSAGIRRQTCVPGNAPRDG
jgi:hypothetical protein